MDIETIQSVEIDPGKLKAARGDRSPSEVARLFDITYQQLWAIENGDRKPSAPLLVKLCLLYGVDLKDVVSEQKILAAA